MSTCTTEKLPFYDLATKSDPTQPFYDKASPTDVDVLAATTNSAGVSAVYSIPLDTGNDFAAYDRVRAETLPSNNSMAVYATHTAAPRGGGRHESEVQLFQRPWRLRLQHQQEMKRGAHHQHQHCVQAGRARLLWDGTPHCLQLFGQLKAGTRMGHVRVQPQLVGTKGAGQLQIICKICLAACKTTYPTMAAPLTAAAPMI